jgi:hypothetical protein
VYTAGVQPAAAKGERVTARRVVTPGGQRRRPAGAEAQAGHRGRRSPPLSAGGAPGPSRRRPRPRLGRGGFVSGNSRQGVSGFSAALRRGWRSAKSKQAPGLRARAVGGGVGEFCFRWYESGTGRYTRPDPLDRIPTAFRLRAILPPDNLYGYALQRPLMLTDPLGLLADDPPGCVTRWMAAGAAVGAGVGAAIGSTAGAAVGGTVCTPAAPGVGTVGCGAAGGGAGGFAGGLQGALYGAAAGAIVGILACTCDPPIPDRARTREECYRLYLEETALCGQLYTYDYDYDRCMANAWRNYIRCLNGLPPRPFRP